jgi:hypothetical protein
MQRPERSAIRTIVTIFATMTVLGTSSAEPSGDGPAFLNANDLYIKLSANDATTLLVGVAYVAGVADAGSGGTVQSGGWRFCLQPNMTQVQIADVVKLWLDRHPEKRHFGAAGVVAHALEESFPCR